MVRAISIDEFESLPATKDVPIASGRALDIDEFERLGRIEDNITNDIDDPDTFLEQQLHKSIVKAPPTIVENLKEAWAQGDASSNIDIMSYHASIGDIDYDKDVH